MLFAWLMTSQLALPAESLDRWEPAGVPAITYRSDLGLGLGILGATTRFRPGCQPFCWRALVLLQGVFRMDDDDLVVPTRNGIIFLDIPQWLRPRWRLLVAAADYDEKEVGYRGLGTRSVLGDPGESSSYRWHRRLAGFKIRQRLRGDPLAATGFRDAYMGLELAWNRLQLSPNSKLAMDHETARAGGDETAALLSRQLGPDHDHADGLINGGLIVDSRDHEFTPQQGTVHEFSGRIGKAGDGEPWFNLFVESAYFLTVLPNRLVFASRALLDHVIGAIPIYRRSEMSGLVPSQGVAGAEGIRGLPAYDEMGKSKVLFNSELRLRLMDHSVLKQRLSWRAIIFTDLGRAFTDLHDADLNDRGLDGRWWQFRWGLGAGLRLRWGQAFVLRLDSAVAPLEGLSGLYFGTDHLF